MLTGIAKWRQSQKKGREKEKTTIDDRNTSHTLI
jgi:hypothetical protein